MFLAPSDIIMNFTMAIVLVVGYFYFFKLIDFIYVEVIWY